MSKVEAQLSLKISTMLPTVERSDSPPFAFAEDYVRINENAWYPCPFRSSYACDTLEVKMLHHKNPVPSDLLLIRGRKVIQSGVLLHGREEAYLPDHLAGQQNLTEDLIHSARKMNRIAVHLSFSLLLAPHDGPCGVRVVQPLPRS